MLFGKRDKAQKWACGYQEGAYYSDPGKRITAGTRELDLLWREMYAFEVYFLNKKGRIGY